MAKKIKLGADVQYVDSQGYSKLAFVIGTSKTIVEGTDIPVPADDEAHLLVCPPSGVTYARYSVVLGEGPQTFSLL